MQKSLNILIVCEHASSRFGGEAILPLNYFRLLSQTSHTVYLITHERVRQSLEELEELDHDKIFYIPDTRIHKLLHKYSQMLPHRISIVTFGALMHLLTQYYQRKLAKCVVQEKEIDVVHEPAPVSATQPSAMFGLNTPVIIGPMNGGMTFPPAFSHMSGRVEKLIYSSIRIVSTGLNLLLPGKRNADLLLVANKRTELALPKFLKGKIAEVVENGVFNVKSRPSVRDKGETIKVIYVGRLVDLKCVDIAIEAVSKTKCKARLTIIGDGPVKNALEAKVKKENIKNVNFTGLVDHKDINNYYDDADIFLLPSVRECGGAVVLEAMSRGLSVIATDWGGPADYITSDSGFLVEPLSKNHMVTEFARIIDNLSANVELRQETGLRAIERVKEHFLWDEKIKTLSRYYSEVALKKEKN